MKESITIRCDDTLKEETNEIAKKQDLNNISKYMVKGMSLLNKLYKIGYDLERIDKIIISHYEMTKSQEKTERFRDKLFDEKARDSLKEQIREEVKNDDEELLEMLSDDSPKNTITEMERIQKERELEDDRKKERIDCKLDNEPCNGYDDRNIKYDLSEADCERIFGPNNLFKPKKIKEHLLVKPKGKFVFEEVPEDWDWREELAQLDSDYEKKKNISHKRKIVEEEIKEGMERLGLTEAEYYKTDDFKKSWHFRESQLRFTRKEIIDSKVWYITHDLQWPILMKEWKKKNPDENPNNYFSSDVHKEYKRLVAEFNKNADEKLAKFDLANAEEMKWIEEEKRKRGIKD